MSYEIERRNETILICQDENAQYVLSMTFMISFFLREDRRLVTLLNFYCLESIFGSLLSNNVGDS